MALTVVKNTKNPVKFWFLANYLSPRFIDVIPLMAAKYNFQYELVTYKWPAWLFKQTEKQRIIWAYEFVFHVLSFNFFFFPDTRFCSSTYCSLCQ